MRGTSKTIYEIFDSFTEDEIDAVICTLSEEEKQLIMARYGDDLHNPVATGEWNSGKGGQFYSLLIPKIKRLLIAKLLEDRKKSLQEEERRSEFFK